MATRTIEGIVGVHHFLVSGVPTRQVAGVDSYGAVEGDQIAKGVAEAILGCRIFDPATIRFLAGAIPRGAARRLRDELGTDWWEERHWSRWEREARIYHIPRPAQRAGDAWHLEYQGIVMPMLAASWDRRAL